MQNVIASTSAQPASKRRGFPVKFLVGGLVILAVLAYVAFNSFQSNSVYYFTLKEFNAQQAKLVGQTVRVNGPLDKSSIQANQKTLELKFNLQDGNLILPVYYKGVAPDTLTTGDSVVAEGRLDQSGVFQADDLLVKCPSKYQENQTASK